MSYWFGKGKEAEENKKCVVPYTPHTTEEAFKQFSLSKDFQLEVYNDHYVLNDVFSMLVNMLMACRSKKNKCLTLNEEDLKFLCDIAGKKSQLKLY